MTDDELMTVLRGAIEEEERTLPVEPAPPSAVSAAEAAFDWVATDDLLAELVYDSADAPLALTRASAPRERQVSYRMHELTIDCEVTGTVLLGQVHPADGVRLELYACDGDPVPLDVDDEGRFVSERVPPGPVCLRCRRADRPDVLTPWLLP